MRYGGACHRARVAGAGLLAVMLALPLAVAAAGGVAAASTSPTTHALPRAPGGTLLPLHLRWPTPAELRAKGHITIGNTACGSMSLDPSDAVTGGEGLSLGMDWTATTSTQGCQMLDNSCPTFAGDCDAGYWLVGIFCSTLAATDIATGQDDCDLNDIVVLTDDSSGPDNSGSSGTSYNTCTTVATLGSIFGGLPGTLNCITDGDDSDGWSDDWPTGQTDGSASGIYEESGSGTPFRPGNTAVDCPPSAANVAAGAVPHLCAFVVMPIFFDYFCVVFVCTPDVFDSNDGITEETSDYLASVFEYAYAPSITSGGSASVEAGSPLEVTVSSDGDPTPALSESGALPAGVHFTPGSGGSATITGTPQTAGSYPITITASNGVSPAATQGFTLVVRPKPAPPPQGYWLASADGAVAAAGATALYGHLSPPGPAPVVGIDATPNGEGYWEVTRDGTVGAFGDARSYGDLASAKVHAGDIVALAPTTDGRGYWLIGADGGMFAFGDARFHGSLPGDGVHVSDVVGMVAAPSGAGYLLVGADGGVFAFGETHFFGSLPGRGVRVHDIRAILPAPAGTGYLLVGADGGVFDFGHGAPYEGSLPGEHVAVADIVGIALTPDAGGYWMAGADGRVYRFGDADALAVPRSVASHLPIAAIAGR